MLGLIFIYWIGKYFYQLAEKYNQNKWLFAVLGLVVYYSSQIVVGLTIGIVNEIFALGINFDAVGITLLGIVVGVLFTYLFYYLLEKKWSKNKIEPVQSIEDIGKE